MSKDKRKLFLIFIFIFYLIFLFVFISSNNNQNETFIDFLFIGDVIPHDSIRKFADKYTYEYFLSNFFSYISSFMSENSSFFYNLETPILDKMKQFYPYIFSEEKRLPEAFAKYNFKNISISNNHILDWGYDGFYSTIKILNKLKEEYNIYFSGFISKNGFEYCFYKINNIKIGFISITLLLNNNSEFEKISKLFSKKEIDYIPLYIQIKNYKNILSKENNTLLSFIDKIKEIKKNVDISVLGIHWGDEYSIYPSNFQIELSKIFIENGVDIIWGHHPHILEPIMIYKERPVIFSNGNFFSGQARNLNWDSKNNVNENYFFTKSIPIFYISFIKNGEYFKLKSIKLFPFYQLNNNGISLLKPLFDKENNNDKNLFISYEFMRKQFFNNFLFQNGDFEKLSKDKIEEIIKININNFFEIIFNY
jgi:poly-gamma-glutamate synthesis protein (capsule biosynthesis protein)